jgi:hypothetical protein
LFDPDNLVADDDADGVEPFEESDDVTGDDDD